MSRSRRPKPVRRWVRVPLWWLVVGGGLSALLFWSDVSDARYDRTTLDNGYHLTARIDPAWDGERTVPLTYDHPETHEVIVTDTYVWIDELVPKRAGVVGIDVARDDPDYVAIAGDRYPAEAGLSGYVPFVVFPLAFWFARVRTLRLSEALMASQAQTYAMTAKTMKRRVQWKPRLYLFPLDATESDDYVCRVPLVDRRSPKGVFTVEVKGTPRPSGRVIARTRDGEIMWPAGRALLR